MAWPLLVGSRARARSRQVVPYAAAHVLRCAVSRRARRQCVFEGQRKRRADKISGRRGTMITISRKLFQLLPYKLVWFPSDSELQTVAGRLCATHMARVH